MKLKKFFALALAAATLALALTACGSKAGDSADNSDANTDNQTGETVTVKLGVVGGIYDDLWASAKAALADEGIDRVLDMLERHLPKQLLDLVDKARDLLPEHQSYRQEQQREKGHSWGDMSL